MDNHVGGRNVRNATGNYNSAPDAKAFTRPPMPHASFTESCDGGNAQLIMGLRLVRTYAIEALASLGEHAAEAGAVAAEHAFASSFASLRCNWRAGFAAPGVYQTSHPAGRALAFGGGFRDAFTEAHRVLAHASGDPMSTGRAAVAATNAARTVVDASLVAVEAFAQAACAGARAALAAKAGK